MRLGRVRRYDPQMRRDCSLRRPFAMVGTYSCPCRTARYLGRLLTTHSAVHRVASPIHRALVAPTTAQPAAENNKQRAVSSLGCASLPACARRGRGVTDITKRGPHTVLFIRRRLLWRVWRRAGIVKIVRGSYGVAP